MYRLENWQVMHLSVLTTRYAISFYLVTLFPLWSFAEKTFVKQSMMLCAFEILLKNGRKTGGNCSSMNISSVVSHAWAVKHELSSVTSHAWVVTRERPCRYKSTNLVLPFVNKAK